ncbi:hypothetical protein C5167_007419 [Papaver somniferum]|uniref:MLP-like protein 34 n=1 Tax=Papaver somniferum TaxID=3469 RepID=UPI000E6F9561|nr:MLP-like protein 34 [Papaver somniferum]RZC86233.1 hypothetical protein C5167_007419 [Papaver somniferum]
MTETHVQVEVKAKCSAKKLFSVMTRGASKLSKYAPKTVQNVQVLPGDGEIGVGSVFVWNYILEGSVVMAKEELTSVDHKNMSLTCTIFDGELTNHFKIFTRRFSVTPTQRDANYNCLVKWSVHYEKLHEHVPDPTYVNKWVEDFIKELDTNLLKEAE